MATIDKTIALAGNPNCGKTALFNALTGGKQRVGNWPGVTVERKEGRFGHISVIDLPGTYSLIQDVDEVGLDHTIACDFLLSKQVDVIVNVIDASHLERHLYLTYELLDMQRPMIIVLNMMDLVEKQGVNIDIDALSQELGCLVIPVSASKKKGIAELKAAIEHYDTTSDAASRSAVVSWPDSVHAFRNDLAEKLAPEEKKAGHVDWLALRLLENDPYAQSILPSDLLAWSHMAIKTITADLGEDADIIIADYRYRAIDDLVSKVIVKKIGKRTTVTQKIDRFVLNRFLGIPFFFLMMYGMFFFAVNIAGAFQDFFDILSSAFFVDGAQWVLTQCHAPEWLIGLLAYGVGSGINTTLTFVPVIGGMFLFLSFLEDSGYMARAAFVMDRLMSMIGLPGESFVPMIIGFGCNVPSVMSVRTLSRHSDRIVTILMMPFISCGARLAIFAVFASAFFPKSGHNMIFFLYVLGLLVAVLTGLFVRRWLLPGKPSPLVMELPEYHCPQVSVMLRHAWQRLSVFIVRAGKVIVPVCMILGGLNAVSLPSNAVHSGETVLSGVAKVVTPVFEPMGIQSDNWPATVGLLTGVLAKEVVVGTLDSLYSQQAHLEDDAVIQSAFDIKQSIGDAFQSIPDNIAGLGDALINPVVAAEADTDVHQGVYGVMGREFLGAAGAFSYLIFILLYVPCVSTMAAVKREIGKHWMWFSILWSTGLAYALAIISFQALTFFNAPWHSAFKLSIVMVSLWVVLSIMRHYGEKRQGASGGGYAVSR